MVLVDNILQQRERENNPVKVAITGTGAMGQGMINQIANYTPGMKVVAVYNRTLDRAVKTVQKAGISNFALNPGNRKRCQEAFDTGRIIITDNIDNILHLKGLDVIVETTGTIEFAFKAITGAFENGIHVLSFNAELDSIFGPLLNKLAKDYGVRYSLGDGDQPGVIMNLYRHVRGFGLEPLVCGNIKGLEDHYRNPDTQKAFAKKWGISPEMATSFADGTKISFEQSCVANATGMRVAKRGMLGYHSDNHVDNLTHLFDIDNLREHGGIVDYIVGARPSPGVFVYAATEDPYSRKALCYMKMGEGPLYCFYHPYHLLFYEVPGSICRLVDFNDPVIVALNGLVVDVVAAAKTDLKKGETLDGIGGFKTYGLCENHDIVRDERLLPMALAMGSRLKRKVSRDEVLTFDDVEMNANNFLIEIFQKQAELFQDTGSL